MHSPLWEDEQSGYEEIGNRGSGFGGRRANGSHFLDRMRFIVVVSAVAHLMVFPINDQLITLSTVSPVSLSTYQPVNLSMNYSCLIKIILQKKVVLF